MKIRKREKTPFLLSFIFVSFFLLNVMLIFSPLLLPTNTVHNLDGTVGTINNDFKMPFPINIVYLFGDLLCHQKEARSLEINQNQMPFCSRCFAIFLGLLFGTAIALFIQMEATMKFLILFIILIIPISVDGLGQMLNYWESTNLIRLITGYLAGLISGISIGVIYDEFKKIRLELNR